MATAAAFRGRDGIRYWVDGAVGFAHLALHTTPESVRERQPLLLKKAGPGRAVGPGETAGLGGPASGGPASGEPACCLTADARIDGRRELEEVLTTSGHLDHHEPTDADLILAAYRCWGEQCPEHLVGDYAFAVWDGNQRKLFCARDVVGAKPFHYHFDGRTFHFASDLRQILADPAISRDLDGYAISDFLTFNFRHLARTMFGAIQRLLPGHCLVLDADGPRAWRYWNPDETPQIRYRSEDQYVEHFRDLLWHAVGDRMRSHSGRAAILTSGGVDSSSVAALAQHLYASGRSPTQPIAYTIAFERHRECDERHYAMELADDPGIEFRQVTAEKFGLLDSGPTIESPIILGESLFRHLHSQMREDGCDVVMDGVGGDSLFDGAKLLYWDEARSGRWWRLRPWLAAGRESGFSWPQAIRSYCLVPLTSKRLRYWLDSRMSRSRYWHVPRWLRPELADKTSAAERLFQSSYTKKFRGVARQYQYEDIISLAQQSPGNDAFVGRAAAAHLDHRFPLLDRRLAEFVLATPVELGAKPGRGKTKWLLRRAMEGLLPERIRQRPDKTGWGPYLTYQLYQESAEEVRGLFADSQLGGRQLVDENLLLEEFEAFCDGKNDLYDGSSILYPLCMEWWLQKHTHREQAILFEQLEPWQYE